MMTRIQICGAMVALTLVPVGAHAKDKSEPLHVLGNPGQFFGPDAYPPEALRAGEQGRSVVLVAVDANGVPSGCTIKVSSGSTSLDAKTCAIAQANLRFSPPRDSHGRAIASSYTLPVRWVLPAAPQPSGAFVTFSGTANAPVCSVMVSQVARHIVPGKCRALVDMVLSRGGSLSQPLSIVTPDESDLSPFGQ